MKLKGLVDYDISNYRKPSMFLIFPNCTFKCDKECGRPVCQNSMLAKEPEIETSLDDVIDNYIISSLTHAIVCGGLEPFDSWEDLSTLVKQLRVYTEDDIVIYTGYTKKEISQKIDWLAQFPNIIIKFGRFIPNKEPHFDKILGVKLSSPNQYAEVIS